MAPRIFWPAFACSFLLAGCSLEPDASITGPDAPLTHEDGVEPPPAPAQRFFDRIVAGGVHSCALDAAGTAYCWGNDGWNGLLGDGVEAVQRIFPGPVAGELTFIDIGTKGAHTCALDAAGDAYCWGHNGSGQLGDGTTRNRDEPTLVSGGHEFVVLSVGPRHTCGLETSGAAYCWGYNFSGQLGDGTTTDRATPTLVSGAHSFVSISAGVVTCALDADGAAYCWGADPSGLDATLAGRHVPTRISGDHEFVAIESGWPRCGLDVEGTVHCWGPNRNGELGDGTTTDRALPTPVAGNHTFVALSTGQGRACAIDTSGAAYCWGSNHQGGLGDGTDVAFRSSPTPVSGDIVFASISVESHVCALDVGGGAYCWGGNQWGQLGTGTTSNVRVPTPVVEAELSTSHIRAGIVSDLTAMTESESILILRWTQVDDGTGNPAFYRLKYAESPLRDWKSAATLCDLRGSRIGEAMTCGISGLKPGTSYDFQLMSFRYQDRRWVGAEYSNIATGTTYPLSVDDLEVVGATASTLTLRWTQVQDGRGEPAFYRVRFGSPLDVWKEGTIGCDREIRGTEIGAEMTCTVEGLDPGTSYELQLYSYYYDDDGKWALPRASNKTTGTTVDTGASGSDRIAFTRGGDDGSAGVYVMNADGTEPVLLTEGGGSPDWSSDGSRIAFEGHYQDIYVMNADGSGRINVTNSTALSAWEPAWSPDGTRIAFVSDRDFEEIGEIYVMNADGTGQTRLTFDGQGAYQPSWSPDGSKIAFTNDRDGDIEAFDNHEIFVMNADGSEQTNLTNRDGTDQSPAWSPDGTRIAFASRRDGNLDIYVMNADGTDVLRLTDHPDADLAPAWSPDGTRIAFQAERDFDWEIFVMNADGSGQTNVTNREGYDGEPAWRPSP